MNNLWKLIRGYIARVPHGAAGGYVALVLLFAFMTLTSVTDVLDRRAAVAEASDTLAQLEGRFPKRGSAGASGMTGSPVLEGPTVTVAGAVLLQRVAEAITKVGGNILSSQVDLQGPQIKDGFISVTANCDVEQPALQQLLYSLEFGDAVPVRRSAGGASADGARLLGGRRGQGRGSRQDARPHFRVGAMAGSEMISHSALTKLIGALALAAMPLAATAIAQAPGTPGVSVRADLGPTPRIKSGELDRAPPSGNPLWAIPIKDLSETRDRPIFTPSRRPPPPPVVEKPYTPPPPPPRVETKPPPEPLTLSLLGTIAGESDGVALFMEKGSQEVVRLRTGESHEGWVLRSVQGRQAMLEKGDRKETVTLPAPGDTGATAGAPPGVPVMPGASPGVPGAPGAPAGIPENGRRTNRR